MTINEGGQIADTGNGFIQGVQPAQPRTAGEWGQPPRPDQAVQQPQVILVPGQQPNPAARWTDEDLERARQQEKEKLYGRIDEMSTQLTAIQEERAAEQAERERLAQEAADAARLREEGEMEVRDLLARRETEWQQQLAALESRYDTDRAIFERERQFNAVQEYRRDRIQQESEFILPELRDLVSGENEAAIDASIEAMKARTEQIFANMQAAMPTAPFQQPRGAAPTAPPVGPMETLPSYEQLTPEAIQAMDMETYKRYRPQLLAATNPNRGRQR